MNDLSFFDYANLCLRPPGEGVFTVSNAKERKNSFHQKIYGSHENVKDLWLKQLQQNLVKDFAGVAVLGVCSDTGGGIQRGANWGPLFVRDQVFSHGAWDVLDLGDVAVVPHLLHDKYLNSETIKNVRTALYQNAQIDLPVSPLSLAEETIKRLYQAYPKTKFFGIGGDHSISYAFVKAWAEAPVRKNKKLGLIHFDAHTDLLTERLGIDLCFATWVPPILPLLGSSDHAFQIGIRSSGKERGHWEKSFGLHQLWSHEIKQEGMTKSLLKLQHYLEEKKFDEVYISFDIDALDSEYASATGTPETGGLAPHEAKLFIELVASYTKVTGSDMMEVAPFVNINNESQGQYSTLESAALISRALTDIMNEN